MVDEEKRPGGQAGALPQAELSEKKSPNLSPQTEKTPIHAPLSPSEEREIDELLDAMQEEYLGFWAERRNLPGSWEDEP